MARSLVESSVGKGEASGGVRSGISVQPSTTASQPCAASQWMMRTYSARDCSRITPLQSSSKITRSITSGS